EEKDQAALRATGHGCAGPYRAIAERARSRLLAQVVDDKPISAVLETGRHVSAHRAQSNETDHDAAACRHFDPRSPWSCLSVQLAVASHAPVSLVSALGTARASPQGYRDAI